ncbi:MAG: sialidase family protein [Halobacteriaceae archaeon]
MPNATPEWTVEKRASRTLRSAPDRDWLGRPAMAARPDGAWILTYRAASHHGPRTDSAVHIAFSDDGGETWTDDDTTLDGTAVEGFPHTRPGGEVGGGTVKHHGGDLLFHSNEIPDPDSPDNVRACRQLRSTDGGRTWTDEGVLDPDGIAPGSVVLGQDHAVDPETGDLYEGVNYKGEERTKSGLARTRDGGRTWEYVGDVTGFDEQTGEIGIVFVGGELLALLRDIDIVERDGAYVLADPSTYARRSPDRGETWGELREVSDGLGVLQRARVYRPADIGGTAREDGWLYAVGRTVHDIYRGHDRGSDADRRHVQGSQHTAIAASPDAGETWYGPHDLDEWGWPAPFGDCGYCDLRVRADGDLYVATYGGHSFHGPTDVFGYRLRETGDAVE